MEEEATVTMQWGFVMEIRVERPLCYPPSLWFSKTSSFILYHLISDKMTYTPGGSPLDAGVHFRLPPDLALLPECLELGGGLH